MKKMFCVLGSGWLFFLCLLAGGCQGPGPETRAFASPEATENSGGLNLSSETLQGGASGGPSDTNQINVSPEAEALLKDMRQAYRQLKTAELDGTIWASFELKDDTREMRHRFNSAFKRPFQFKHVLERDLLIGSSGTNLYIYQKSANAYYQTNLDDTNLSSLPRPLPQLLQAQNPSLLMAMAADPLSAIGLPVQSISRTNDVLIAGKNCPALFLRPADGDYSVTLVLDQDTKLLRRFSVDISTVNLKGGGDVGPIKSVRTEVDYATIKRDEDFDADFFAWAPPEGAESLASLDEDESATALEGKAAPAFSLQTLDGAAVSLAELKGHVVVLDFWATWCPPCRKSLPGLAQLYKDKAGAGVLVYAVNVKEAKEQVQAFLRQQNYTIPVLLDPDGEVAQEYGVSGIPQTVVIGKDGKVRRVFIGATPKTEEEIRAEVELSNREP